jgi:hypothetical protein
MKFTDEEIKLINKINNKIYDDNLWNNAKYLIGLTIEWFVYGGPLAIFPGAVLIATLLYYATRKVSRKVGKVFSPKTK